MASIQSLSDHEEDQYSSSEDEKIIPTDKDTGKERGNELFRNGDTQGAIREWETSLRSCEYIIQKKIYQDERLEEIHSLRVSLLSNIALGYYRLQQYSSAVKSCDAVLKSNPGNIKVLFRKAESLYRMGEYDQAKDVAEKMLLLDSESNDAKILLKNISIANKNYLIKSKKMMSGVMKRMSQETEDSQGASGNQSTIFQTIIYYVTGIWAALKMFFDDCMSSLPREQDANNQLVGTNKKFVNERVLPVLYEVSFLSLTARKIVIFMHRLLLKCFPSRSPRSVHVADFYRYVKGGEREKIEEREKRE